MIEASSMCLELVVDRYLKGMICDTVHQLPAIKHGGGTVMVWRTFSSGSTHLQHPKNCGLHTLPRVFEERQASRNTLEKLSNIQISFSYS